ncbi:MAG: acyl-CoA acyltransferase [Deltaproteobacteria bacterium]|nr:acyl-CoA acyltransferase [Deltaproteobacteria bacterium]
MARRLMLAEYAVRAAGWLARYLRWAYWSRRARRLWKKLGASTKPLSSPVRCREIVATDLENVINLLTFGFERRRTYWTNAIRILSERSPPPGLPRYGYVLESGGALVGVLLMIFSARTFDGTTRLQGAGSGFYVEPPFRSFAPMLISRTHRSADVSYLNITPSRHTWPMLDAKGFKRFVNGRFVSIPILCNWSQNLQIQVREATARTWHDSRLEPFETELLSVHAECGCICLLCECEEKLCPFVFRSYWSFGLPFTHLIYCRNLNDFVWAAAALGQALAKRGLPLVVVDADGPVRGLIGKFFEIRPRYWKGTKPPPPGDLAYTEIAMFGF